MSSNESERVPGDRREYTAPVDTRTITWQGQTTLAEHRLMNAYHIHSYLKPLVILFFTALIWYLGWKALEERIAGHESPTHFLVLAAVYYWPFAFLFNLWKTVGNTYKQNQERFQPYTMQVTATDVMLTSRYFDERFDWIWLNKVVDTPDGLLIYLSPTQVLAFVTHEQLPSGDKRELLLEWARAQGTPVLSMKRPWWYIGKHK